MADSVALDSDCDADATISPARAAPRPVRPTWATVVDVLGLLAGSGAAISGGARTFRLARLDGGSRILVETETTSRWIQLADLHQCWTTFERLGRIVRADVLEPARCSAFVMALFRAVPGVHDPAGDATSLVLP